MSQTDLQLTSGVAGADAFRELLTMLEAVISTNIGSDDPSTTWAGQLVYNSTTSTLKMRNSTNSGWIVLGTFDQAAGTWSPTAAGATFTGQVAVPAAIEDGNAVNLGQMEGRKQAISASGGDTSDLTTSFQNRLSVTFTATGRFVSAAARFAIGCNHDDGCDFLAYLEIYDNTSGANANTGAQFGSSTQNQSGLGYAAPAAGGIAYGNLTIGHSYTIRLWMKKTQNIGPNYAVNMSIWGVCV
ncbi:hypothetical protein [Acidimangrovimonas sediminis]|uniref:hypothetical protein n=1 Tax=Acidimangrovimonas sediminis TaxID=2056283 RepID=UPI000C80759B|nr:hypothetical protein [Acidimangrovimonas sediminis]